jgi:hypothetical protein
VQGCSIFVQSPVGVASSVAMHCLSHYQRVCGMLRLEVPAACIDHSTAGARSVSRAHVYVRLDVLVHCCSYEQMVVSKHGS